LGRVLGTDPFIFIERIRELKHRSIWPINLSHDVPASTVLHGFDLKTDLLPRPEWLPSNVSFHELNVFDPVPEQFAGKYDVVHFRYLSPVVQKGDPSPLINCALKLLSKFVSINACEVQLIKISMIEPGGLFQWDERDMNLRILGAHNTRAMEALIEGVQELAQKTVGNIKYVSLKSLLRVSTDSIQLGAKPRSRI
jgi:hypothetical protein